MRWELLLTEKKNTDHDTTCDTTCHEVGETGNGMPRNRTEHGSNEPIDSDEEKDGEKKPLEKN